MSLREAMAKFPEINYEVGDIVSWIPDSAPRDRILITTSDVYRNMYTHSYEKKHTSFEAPGPLLVLDFEFYNDIPVAKLWSMVILRAGYRAADCFMKYKP